MKWYGCDFSGGIFLGGKSNFPLINQISNTDHDNFCQCTITTQED